MIQRFHGKGGAAALHAAILEQQCVGHNAEVADAFVKKHEVLSFKAGDPLIKEAVMVTGTVLYADIDGSTSMVDRFDAHFCAEVYKSFLLSAGKLIRSESGVITAYDGDRVMAVYIGDDMHDRAVKSAMKISKAVGKIINPLIREVRKKEFQLRHSIGIDTSSLFVVRTGVRGATDLVWVGPAANYAAKMSAISESPYKIFITQTVYDGLSKNCTHSGGKNMWTYKDWGGKRILKTNYWGFLD